MTQRFLASVLILILICSCEGESKEKKEADKNDGSIDLIEDHFTSDSRMDPVHLGLLKELDICNSDLLDSTSLVAKCTPDNFKLYSLSDDISIKDAFVVQTRSALILKGSDLPLPVRHAMIFERENGKLVQVMGIRGEIIAMEKGKSDHKDIYAAIYYKKDDTMFNCKFTWNGSMYIFSLESLDWGEGPKAVKASARDSLTDEVYAQLRDAKLLF